MDSKEKCIEIPISRRFKAAAHKSIVMSMRGKDIMLDITLRSLSLLVYLFLISYFFLIGQQLLKS